MSKLSLQEAGLPPLVHYTRPAGKPRTILEQDAHRVLHGMMLNIEAKELPIEHTYDRASSTENFVFPAAFEQVCAEVLRDAGFIKQAAQQQGAAEELGLILPPRSLI